MGEIVSFISKAEKKSSSDKISESDRKGIRIITAINRMEELKDHVEGKMAECDYLYFCFLVYTSLRKEEILGLRWHDIDFLRMEIRFQNRVTFRDDIDDPVVRSFGGERAGVVHLESELIKHIQPYQRKAGFVFSDCRLDTPLTKNLVDQMWIRIVEKLDLEDFTEYSFRAGYKALLALPAAQLSPELVYEALQHEPFRVIKGGNHCNRDDT